MKKYYGVLKVSNSTPGGPFETRDEAITFLFKEADRLFKTLPLKNAALMNSRIREIEADVEVEKEWFKEHCRK
jgi:hypothetical protein